MSTDAATAALRQWGELAEPLHLDAAGPEDPRWGENAYLGFWSHDEPIFGVVHLMTSPNADGRRARCSVSVDGSFAEVHEELPPDSFTSPSIDFDVFGVGGGLVVDHPQVGIELACRPRLDVVRFEPYSVVKAHAGRDPLVHYELYCEIEGRVRVGNSWRPISGRGFRDRTWGFRDDGTQVVEHIALCASFDEFDIGMIKVLADDELRVDSYLNTIGGVRKLTDFRFTRGAAGLFRQVTLALEDGEERTIRAVGELGIAWVPVGTEREGPAFSMFDHYLELECDGQRGRGFAEQGVRHVVW